MGPADDFQPLLIALTDDRAERLFRNDFRQDHSAAGIGQLGAQRRKLRGVGRQDVATAAFEALDGLVRRVEGDRRVGHALRAEIVGEVQFGRGAGLNADRRAIKFRGAIDAERSVHEKALTVIIVEDAREGQAQRIIAGGRHRGVARQQIDFARLQRGETLFRGQRHEAHFVRIAENGGGDGAAQINVNAAPIALIIGVRKARQARRHAASQLASAFRFIESLRLNGGRGHGRAGESGDCKFQFHVQTSIAGRLHSAPLTPCVGWAV